MERITYKQLEHLLERINKIRNKPLKPYDSKTRKVNIGNWHLYGAYGKTGVHEMVNENGGVHTVYHLTTKREVYNFLYAVWEMLERDKKY